MAEETIGTSWEEYVERVSRVIALYRAGAPVDWIAAATVEEIPDDVSPARFIDDVAMAIRAEKRKKK